MWCVWCGHLWLRVLLLLSFPGQERGKESRDPRQICGPAPTTDREGSRVLVVAMGESRRSCGWRKACEKVWFKRVSVLTERRPDLKKNDGLWPV